MTRRHVYAALGLLLLALLGGCAAPGPSPEALTELSLALEDSEQSGDARLKELLLRYPDHLPLLELALAHSEAQGDQEGRLRYARAAFSAALGADLSPDALEARERALLDALRAPPAPAPVPALEEASADDRAFLDELAFYSWKPRPSSMTARRKRPLERWSWRWRLPMTSSARAVKKASA